MLAASSTAYTQVAGEPDERPDQPPTPVRAASPAGTMARRLRNRYFACLLLLLVVGTTVALLLYRRNIAIALRRHRHLFQVGPFDLNEPQHIPLVHKPGQPSQTSPSSPLQTKRVVLWSDFFGQKDYVDDAWKQDCPVTNCEFRSSRDRLEEADAVMFHFPNLHRNDLPTQKSSHQQWVLLVQESPKTYPFRKIMKSFNGRIDITATYR